MATHLSAIPAALTIELPFEHVSERRPGLESLTIESAEEVGLAIARDLQRILGELDRCGMVVVGAAYDLTEMLRPGLPAVDILMEIYRGSMQGGGFVPHFMAVGTRGGRFPIPSIEPAVAPGAGPLLIVPFVFVGEPEELNALSSQVEKSLLEKGQASSETERLVNGAFGVEAVNLAYATFNDLCALLKIQLEHNGFDGLWTLLEGALFHPDERVLLDLPSQNHFLLDQNRVYTPFLTFDHWAERTDRPLDQLVEGYGHWIRTQRQYQAALEAHGLDVVTLTHPWSADASADQALSEAREIPAAAGARLVETLTEKAPLDQAATLALTEHSLPRLGPVAYTALAQDTDGAVVYLANEYPLRPEGITEIREHWSGQAERLGLELQIIDPGTVVFSESSFHLLPFSETDLQTH